MLKSGNNTDLRLGAAAGTHTARNTCIPDAATHPSGSAMLQISVILWELIPPHQGRERGLDTTTRSVWTRCQLKPSSTKEKTKVIQQLHSQFLRKRHSAAGSTISPYLRHFSCLRNRLFVLILLPIYPLAEGHEKSLAMKSQTHVGINFLFEKFQSCFIRDWRPC